MKILGLDLGVNSIGWGLVEKNAEGKMKIIDAGVVIPFTSSKDAMNFKQGKELEMNKDRRQKRILRRLLYRKKRRNQMLFLLAKTLGVVSENAKINSQHLYSVLFPNQKVNYKDVHKWRANATKEKIEIPELIAVLFSMNQKRGYSHGLKNEKNKIPIKARIKEYNPDTKTGKIEVLLKLYEEGLPNEFEAKINLPKNFPVKENQEYLGYLSNKGTEKEKYYEFAISNVNEGKTFDKGEKEYNDYLIFTKLLLQQKTPGEFFYEKLQQNASYGSIKNILLPRDEYVKEFNKIWEKQKAFHPELSDEKILQKFKKALINYLKPSAPVRKKIENTKDLQELVRDWILYYQRPQKKAIGRGLCFYEKNNKTISRSHPLFQEFRIWQTIHNIKLHSGELTPAEKEKLFEILWFWEGKETPEWDNILPNKKIKNTRLKISHNKTYYEFYKVFKEFPEVWKMLKKEDILSEDTPLKQLWQIIYSAPDEETIKKGCKKWIDRHLTELIEEEKQKLAENLAEVEFESSYGELSAKAIKKLLTLMRAGKYFREDNLPDKNPETPAEIIPTNKGLHYDKAATYVYGDHRANYGNPYKSPEELKITREDLLKVKHPVVLGIIASTLKLIKEIWKEYEKPDRIHIEFARELRANAKAREQMHRKIKENERENNRIRQILKDNGVPKPSLPLIKKYKLWEETKHKCLYCGQNIELEAVINGTAEIDYIIPHHDTGQTNKIVVHRKCNREKYDKTSFDFIASKGIKELRIFLKNIREVIELNTKKIPSKDWFNAIASELYHYKNEELINKIYENEKNWENALLYFRNKEIENTKNKKIKTTEEVIKDNYWRAKFRRFLASKEQAEEKLQEWINFKNNQHETVKFASKQIYPYLERICPPNEKSKKNVLITSGRITSILRYQWGLIEELKEILTPYYKETNEQDLNPANDDYRYKALNAIIIACTTDSIINRINSFAGKKRQTKKQKRKLYDFIQEAMPLDTEELKQVLAEIIVFYRTKRRTSYNKKKKIQKKTTDGKIIVGKIIKGKTARGQLFNETAYSLKKMPPMKLSKIMELGFVQKVGKEKIKYKWNDFLKQQYHFFKWLNNEDIIKFWEFLWKTAPQKNIKILKQGLEILQNTQGEKQLKALAKLISEAPKDEVIIQILLLTKRESLQNLSIKDIKDKILDYNTRKLLLEIIRELELDKKLKEKDKLGIAHTEAINKKIIQKNKNFPPIKRVRIYKPATFTHTYTMLRHKSNRPVLQYKNVRMAHITDKEKRIYYLDDIINKRIIPLNEAKKFHPKDLIYLAKEGEKVTIETIDKKRIFVIKSMAPSNGKFLLRHNSFIKKEKGIENLSNIYRLRVNWLGKIENIE